MIHVMFPSLFYIFHPIMFRWHVYNMFNAFENDANKHILCFVEIYFKGAHRHAHLQPL
jgi:hypothetical protein